MASADTIVGIMGAFAELNSLTRQQIAAKVGLSLSQVDKSLADLHRYRVELGRDRTDVLFIRVESWGVFSRSGLAPAVGARKKKKGRSDAGSIESP